MIPDLRNFTSARVVLGRSGNALPTAELLNLHWAHARAREAVHSALDVARLRSDLEPLESVLARSAAPDRATYLRRPDLGRQLDNESRASLATHRAHRDVVFVVADGLSATAVQLHAASMVKTLLPLLSENDWQFFPVVVVEQGRVAVGDDIGETLGAALAVVLIGERPGLSAADSLGIYLTYAPKLGVTDADRNCISNIREGGLSYAAASHRLAFLMTEARTKKISGVYLKEPGQGLLS